MTNLFDSYTSRIKNALQQDRLEKAETTKYINFSNQSLRNLNEVNTLPKRFGFKPESSLLTLQSVILPQNASEARIGEHPDFRHLKGTDNTSYHYITSVFIDIKGSTSLNDKYDLDTIYLITNTVQSAAIHVCLIFGGHIQRLQGDGVFVYFGGKNITHKDAVTNAVSAASLFTYFVKNDLQSIFEEEGVENICTRTGIDFGDDDQVLWANFGVGECTELTTLSLHTSLAAKMQSYAPKNGIVLGQNVKDKLDVEENLFDYVRNSKGEITQRYIYIGKAKGLYYTQYKFDWQKFLKNLPFIKADSEGKLFVQTKENAEKDRLHQLAQIAAIINSNDAYTAPNGNIVQDATFVKNQEHRFHHE
ncbi:MAG: adenylate/guanylate cyclase domain-containing protein [Chitinophagaceae bacterium]|nr:MAG: adenylate/guanylate cyclase domain-containing protein [Chitinophagaceae bacterium]